MRFLFKEGKRRRNRKRQNQRDRRGGSGGGEKRREKKGRQKNLIDTFQHVEKMRTSQRGVYGPLCCPQVVEKRMTGGSAVKESLCFCLLHGENYTSVILPSGSFQSKQTCLLFTAFIDIRTVEEKNS